MELVIENLRLNFKYDIEAFIQNDIFAKISHSLAQIISV